MTIPVSRLRVSFVNPSRHRMKGGTALCLALVLACVPAQAQDATAQAYHERSFILAANTKCRLFDAPVEQALGAAALQTRGVLLRAGHETAQVGAVASRAAGLGRAVSCADPALQETTGRIVHAFSRWSRAARLEFPARYQSWRVDRFAGSKTGWRMVQDSAVGTAAVRFGLAGLSPEETSPTVVVSFRGKSRPYAARLVMRDMDLLPRPHAVTAGQAQMPPFSGRKIIFAARQTDAPDTLLGEGKRRGEAWEFPQEAMLQVTRLDPREPFWIEFLFRDDSVARVPFEAGDAGAATAFLGLGRV